MPSWTWIHEDAENNEAVSPLLDELAQQYTTIISVREHRQWDREDDDEYFDTEEEYQEFQQMERYRFELEELRLEGILAQLQHFGARIMRPYEHWNEDERYMEFMENRY